MAITAIHSNGILTFKADSESQTAIRDAYRKGVTALAGIGAELINAARYIGIELIDTSRYGVSEIGLAFSDHVIKEPSGLVEVNGMVWIFDHPLYINLAENGVFTTYSIGFSNYTYEE